MTADRAAQGRFRAQVWAKRAGRAAVQTRPHKGPRSPAPALSPFSPTRPGAGCPRVRCWAFAVLRRPACSPGGLEAGLRAGLRPASG